MPLCGKGPGIAGIEPYWRATNPGNSPGAFVRGRRDREGIRRQRPPGDLRAFDFSTGQTSPDFSHYPAAGRARRWILWADEWKERAGLKGLGVAPSTGLVLFHLASQRCDYQLDVFEWRSKVRTLSTVTTRAGRVLTLNCLQMQALTCKWSN